MTPTSTLQKTQSNSPSALSSESVEHIYLSKITWHAERPETLVICCSDGRLEMSIDDFIHSHLQISNYDRLYMPGGPGALSTFGGEQVRPDVYRKDLEFLLKAHIFNHVVLILHGATLDGPIDGVCAHYRKIMPEGTHLQILERQHDDIKNVSEYLLSLRGDLHISAFRAEARADEHLRFVTL